MLNRMIVASLEQAGYTNVRHFENGKLAYDYVKTCLNNGTLRENVQCIITDIEMPLMDGHSFTKLIKSDEATHMIPVVIFSSLINEEMRKKGEQLGADRQLTKPEIGSLVSAIDELVGIEGVTK